MLSSEYAKIAIHLELKGNFYSVIVTLTLLGNVQRNNYIAIQILGESIIVSGDIIKYIFCCSILTISFITYSLIFKFSMRVFDSLV